MGSIATRRPNGFDARWPFAAAVLLLLASACYAPLGQRAVDSREIYRESGFSRESLRDEGTALLPPRLSFGDETYGAPLLQGLAETLGDALAPDGLVHPNLSASRINQAGVAENYLAMLAAYDATGILDRSHLARVSEAVGARYFGMPTLVDFREGTNSRFSVFGLRLGKTAWANARLRLQIWDARLGKVVWEGSSDLTQARETFRERPVRLADTTRAGWEFLVDQLPPSVAASPPD